MIKMKKIFFASVSIVCFLISIFAIVFFMYTMVQNSPEYGACLGGIMFFGFSMLFYFKLKTEIWREKKNLGIELRMTRFEHIMLRCIGPAFLIVFTLIAAMIVFIKFFFIIKKLLGY